MNFTFDGSSLLLSFGRPNSLHVDRKGVAVIRLDRLSSCSRCAEKRFAARSSSNVLYTRSEGWSDCTVRPGNTRRDLPRCLCTRKSDYSEGGDFRSTRTEYCICNPSTCQHGLVDYARCLLMYTAPVNCIYRRSNAFPRRSGRTANAVQASRARNGALFLFLFLSSSTAIRPRPLASSRIWQFLISTLCFEPGHSSQGCAAANSLKTRYPR